MEKAIRRKIAVYWRGENKQTKKPQPCKDNIGGLILLSPVVALYWCNCLFHHPQWALMNLRILLIIQILLASFPIENLSFCWINLDVQYAIKNSEHIDLKSGSYFSYQLTGDQLVWPTWGFLYLFSLLDQSQQGDLITEERNTQRQYSPLPKGQSILFVDYSHMRNKKVHL